MSSQQPIRSNDERRVLEFRPRVAARTPDQTDPAAQDLSQYERSREQPDEFRHRMLANIAAVAFTVALIAVGIWLAMNIADMRKTQDCIMSGRRNCAPISSSTN